jgi:hypothetical protein
MLLSLSVHLGPLSIVSSILACGLVFGVHYTTQPHAHPKSGRECGAQSFDGFVLAEGKDRSVLTL